MVAPANDSYSVPSGSPVYAGYFPFGALGGGAALDSFAAAGSMAPFQSIMSGNGDLASFQASGGLLVPINPNTALVGDSLTALSYGPLHPYTWTNGIAGGALKFVANCGIASDTIQDVINRIDNSFTSGSPGLAGLTNLGRVFLRIGTNNFRYGGGITSGTQAQYITLFNKCLSYADEVIVFAVPPVGAAGSPDGAGIPSVNAWLSSYCSANAGLKFINDCITVDNGSGNWVAAYDSGDHIHFSNRASCQMGLDGGDLLAAHLGSIYPSPLSTDPADKYPATQQWVTNHTNQGTGIPTGWFLGSYGSGFASSGAIVAADVGDPNQVPWFRVTPTQITAGGGAYLSVGCGLAYPAITTSAPDTLEIMHQIRYNGFDSSKFAHSQLFVYGVSNEQLNPPMFMYLQNGTINRTITARQAIRRSGTRLAHASASLTWAFQAGSTFTGSMGSFDIRCLTIRG